MEDRTWRGDPIYLERRRRTLADIRERVDALTAWFAWARERADDLGRRIQQAKTAELGHYEVNDEP